MVMVFIPSNKSAIYLKWLDEPHKIQSGMSSSWESTLTEHTVFTQIQAELE
jgi:hypothetical protein